MPSKDLRASVLAARRAAVPILVISTPDQWALERTVRELLAGVDRKVVAAKDDQPEVVLESPQMSWDCVRGLVGLNAEGVAVVAKLGDSAAVATKTRSLVATLIIALGFPRLSTLFAHNAHRFIGQDPAVSQAISNLRDPFKEEKRTLVLMGPAFDVPAELLPEVVTLEEPLPDDEAMGEIIGDTYDAVDLDRPAGDDLARAIDAGRGLPAFTAEQVYSMAIGRDGLDLDRAWERKEAEVNRRGTGLTMSRGGPTFDDIGGLDAVKTLGDRLFAGPRPPQVIVRIEEIEKTWAGALGGGDGSGTSANAFGRILTTMQEEGWDGMIGVGLGGTGKSEFGKALAATFDRPRIDMELGQTKGKYVGESEAGIERMLSVLRHVGGRRVFFVASCNKIEMLPPELLRRFRTQVWYFDLPTPAERLSIWPIHLKTYGLDKLHTPEAAEALAKADGWTGAEIHNCCETAWKLNIPLAVAAKEYVVPVSRSSPEVLTKLRDAARNRFLSATHAGTYSDAAPAGAALSLSTPKRRREIGA